MDSHLGPGLLHEASPLAHSSCDSLLLDSGYAPFGLQESPHSCRSDLSADKAEPGEGGRAGAQGVELATQDSAMQYKVLDLAGHSKLAGEQGSCFRSELFNTQESAEQHSKAAFEAEVANQDHPSADASGVQPECQIIEAQLVIATEQVPGSDGKVEVPQPASPEQRYVRPGSATRMTSIDLLSSRERPQTGPDTSFPYTEPSRPSLAEPHHFTPRCLCCAHHALKLYTFIAVLQFASPPFASSLFASPPFASPPFLLLLPTTHWQHAPPHLCRVGTVLDGLAA